MIRKSYIFSSFLATFCICILPQSGHSAETNVNQPMHLEQTGPGPGEVGLIFTKDGLPNKVIRPIETLAIDRTEDTSTSAAQATAIVKALVKGPDKREKAGGIEGFLPAGTTLGKVEVIGTDTIKVYLDIPANFVQSPESYSPTFVEEVAGNFINSLWGTGLNQIYFFVKDPLSGEYRQIRDFLPQENVQTETLKSQAEPGSKKGDSTSEQDVKLLPAQGEIVAGALAGKSVVLNASHGWFDDDNPSRWRVQRTRTFETLEDYCSPMFINFYVIPMLQNAGARIRPVREPDAQSNMVVIDNAMGSPKYVESGSGWFNSSLKGYVDKTVFSGTQDNPFGNASSTRLVPGTTGAATASATYTPAIPATGYYNVYISYAAGSDRTSNAHWQVHHSGGITDFRINQKNSGATWVLLGNFFFEQGAPAAKAKVVALNDNGDTSYLNVDAVRFGGGMGNMARRTHGISGVPRWQEEANNYMQYTGMLASTLMSSDNVASYDDEQLGWSNRPQYANWEQSRDGLGANLIYVGWHTNASGYTCTGGVESSGAGRGTVSYRDVDNDATAGTEDLTAAAHSALISSIRLSYNPNWQDRGIIGSNGYGECSQGNLGSVAGFFFEGLFHDNTLDAAAYKDPKFRYAAARGIVQGIISYYGGTVFPPEPVTNFRVKNVGNGQVQLNWTAGPVRTASLKYGSAPTKYRIYKSTNGYGFDNGTDTINTLTQYITSLPAGETTFLRVAAVNAAGISVMSPTMAVRVPLNGAPTFNIVNGYLRNDQFLGPLVSSSGIGSCPTPANVYRTFDSRLFQSFDYTVPHALAIAAKGDYGIDSCTREAIKLGSLALSDYPVNFWISGQEAEADTADSVDDTSLYAAERTAITNYLQGGGRLFISGSELAWDLGRSGSPAVEQQFLADTLKANYSLDNSNSAVVSSAGIFSGLGNIAFGETFGSYQVRFPDAITPTGGSSACMNYIGGTGGTAAIQYAGTVGTGTQTAKIVYMGFGFETIQSQLNRNAVMSKAIDFFIPATVENWLKF